MPRAPVPASTVTPAFLVDHLSLTFPAQPGQPSGPVLNNISFAVNRGASLTLVGPSGSGKSTLLRCLNRLVEPPPGTVHFHGRDITLLNPLELRRRVALVMQTPVLFEGTIRDNLRMQPTAALPDLSEDRLAQALSEVGLDTSFLGRDGALLSGGERQRVTIARALLGDPEALLLDEPTAALDPPNAALVVETVSQLRHSRGLTTVAATHQPELIRRLGGSLLYLVTGAVRAAECIDGLTPMVTDAHLRAFLAGEGPPTTP